MVAVNQSRPASVQRVSPERAPSAKPLVAPAVRGYDTFRQVAYTGSFEGQTTLGLGVRARLPFRVTTVAGPGTNTRLVVDVAHHW
jgi:hypothetical protein